MVKVNYMGRLGNRLFQYCMGRILAEETGLLLDAEPIPGFPNTKVKVPGLDYSDMPSLILRSEKDQKINLQCLIGRKNKIVLKGFFQRYDYFRNYKRKIRENWLVTDFKKSNLIGKNDLLLHIRLGDYTCHKSILPFSFYLNVFKKTSFDKVFIVTDDPQNPYLKWFNQYSPVVMHQDVLEDFNLIKSANKICISQSTFGWWAAFLSEAKEIYYPVPLEGIWCSKDIDLHVDDEERFIPLKCRN